MSFLMKVYVVIHIRYATFSPIVLKDLACKYIYLHESGSDFNVLLFLHPVGMKSYE